MKRRGRSSPLESNVILRKFSILFFMMSVLPVGLIFYFYNSLKDMGLAGNNLVLPFLLVVIGVCVGYWGMRVVLRDLVNVVKVHTESLETLLGPEKFRELTAGKNEIAVLAHTFDEVMYQLEDHVRKLEMTKKTLHSVLNRIGNGLSAIDDINSFLELILETIADALNAKTGALMLADRNTKIFTIKVIYGLEPEQLPRKWFKIKEGEFRSVIIRKEPAVITSFDRDELPPALEELLFHPPVLCAPLLSRDQVLGVITLSGRPTTELNQDELNLLFSVALQTAVAIENSRLNEDAEKIYFETISALALAVEAKDHYSRGHLDRVANYAVMTAKKLGLSEEDITTLRDAARLHDIGKIGILDEVLRKPGKLNVEERGMMEKHCEIGEGIIAPIHSLRNLCDVVRHHHEYLDGSGYPDKLQGDQISLLARILSVSDIYDALTTTRPYRAALSREETISIMTNEYVRKLDQNIVWTLLELTGSTPG